MILFSNSAFIGYPVIRIIFDENAIFYAAVVNMVFTTIINVVFNVVTKKKDAIEKDKVLSNTFIKKSKEGGVK